MVSNEQIVAALISCNTRQAAADSLGMGITTLYERLRDNSLQALLNEAQGQIVSGATSSLQARLEAAVSTIAEVMTDKDNAPQVRLNAADCLLRNCLRYTEQSQILTRLDELERRLTDAE